MSLNSAKAFGILMPVSSLFSPLLSLMVFIIGTLYELRQVSDCISIKEWGNQLKNQYYCG